MISNTTAKKQIPAVTAILLGLMSGCGGDLKSTNDAELSALLKQLSDNPRDALTPGKVIAHGPVAIEPVAHLAQGVNKTRAQLWERLEVALLVGGTTKELTEQWSSQGLTFEACIFILGEVGGDKSVAALEGIKAGGGLPDQEARRRLDEAIAKAKARAN